MFRNMTKPNIVVLLIIFLGLIFRLMLVNYAISYPERYIQADAIGYNQLAVNLISGHGFSMEANAPFIPNNFRTPIYPLTIASIYSWFGYHPELVLWLQAFIGALTILLTFLLAERIGDRKVGIIAAALLAISPHSVTYSALLWSETEYTLIFILSIILTVFMLTDIKLKWILLSGIVSGLAVLIHPRSLYLPLFFALFFIEVMLKKRIHLKKILINVSIYLLVFNLVLLPWRFRNKIVFGIPNITSATGINMLHYGAALSEAALTGENQWSVSDRFDAELRETSSRPLNSAEYGESAFRLGLNKILLHPLTYAKIHMIGMVKIFLPGTSQINTLLTGQNSIDTTQIYAMFTNSWNRQNGLFSQSLSTYSIFSWFYIGFSILYLCCIYFFSIYAIIRQNRSFPWFWPIIFIIFYLAAVAGPAGAPRFRVVMMPLFSILAAYGMLSTSYISRKLDLL